MLGGLIVGSILRLYMIQFLFDLQETLIFYCFLIVVVSCLILIVVVVSLAMYLFKLQALT